MFPSFSRLFLSAILYIIFLPVIIPINLFSAFKTKKRNKESITVKELLSQIDSETIAKDVFQILKETKEYENILNKYINNTDLLIYNIEKIRDISKQKNKYKTNNYIIELSSLWSSFSTMELRSLIPNCSVEKDKSILFILNVKIDIDVYKELTRNEVLAYIFLDYLLGA
ncbi:hypothetical protein CF067_17590 [Clostridium sporogenes]|uniref:Uncharacterized protein n=1 Tax=Clostridium botulinum B str. Osaka05 TaxID=1407017 RepID=A0A060N983_CLOBO|nr:hypothetical protein [Clostridium botulinum]BAO05223.1 uncharacterized protein CBO05P2_198 [Clostridium botulinum B str. Osaka05]